MRICRVCRGNDARIGKAAGLVAGGLFSTLARTGRIYMRMILDDRRREPFIK
jgi:hypothetical protein